MEETIIKCQRVFLCRRFVYWVWAGGHYWKADSWKEGYTCSNSEL